MPFCTNCGKQLAENEICNCQNAVPPQKKLNNIPPPVNNQNTNVPPGFQQFDKYGRPLFTPQGQPISYDANGNAIVSGKKKSSGGVIAVVIVVTLIVVLFVGGILAAIFVPAMLGYVKKATTSNINAEARTVRNAVTAALNEMDEKGLDINGIYIISSETALNKTIEAASEFDTAEFYRCYDKYHSADNECSWFSVIEDGVVTYCAVTIDENGRNVGTYPNEADVRQGPASYTGIYAGSNTDFAELYRNTFDYLNSTH